MPYFCWLPRYIGKIFESKSVSNVVFIFECPIWNSNLKWTLILSRLLTWLTWSSYLCLLFKLMGVVLGKFYHHFQNTSTFWLDWNWLERKFVFFKEKCSVSAKKQHNMHQGGKKLQILIRHNLWTAPLNDFFDFIFFFIERH